MRSLPNLLLVGLCAAVAGCDASQPDDAPPIDPSIPATWEDLGYAPIEPGTDADAQHSASMDRTIAAHGYERAATEPPDSHAFIAYDVKAQKQYRVTMAPGDLKAHVATLDLAALRAGSPGQGPAGVGDDLAAPVPTGWSDNDDGRQQKSPTDNPSRKTVYFSNNCSGALIGPHHVLTAAHCVVDQGTNNWSNFTVRPGGVDSPYASASPIWFYTPDQYRTPGQSQTFYNRYDYAVVIIDDDLGDTVGWMGHAAWDASALADRTLWNRGYPGCPSSHGNHPAGCDKMGEIWGDVSSCDLGSFYNPEPDGWNANINNSCDISGGHSGSPVYYYNASNVPVAVGVQFWENCYTCPGGDTHPNRMRRLTPSALDWIATWKANWP